MALPILPLHLRRLEGTLQKLQKHGLKVKLEKCKFLQKEVKFLGHVITEDGVRTDPDKVKVVAEWPVPTTLHDLRSFLGFASNYRRFVGGYSSVAAPLHDLVSKCYETGKKRRPATKIKTSLVFGSNPVSKLSRLFRTV